MTVFHGHGEEAPGHLGDGVGEAAIACCAVLGADARVATVLAGGHLHDALLRLLRREGFETPGDPGHLGVEAAPRGEALVAGDARESAVDPVLGVLA